MVEANTNCQHITVQSQQTDAEKLFSFLIKYMSQYNIPAAIRDDLRLAIEETFTNIVSYAYLDKQAHDIHFELTHTSTSINITFTDSGKAFNPLTDGEQFNAENECCDGGMGIHLIKSLTDNQRYKRSNQTNVFTLTKHYT